MSAVSVTLCRRTRNGLLSIVLQTISRHVQYCTNGTTVTQSNGRSGKIRIGDVEIAPWTTAGLESCVVVSLNAGQRKQLHLAFDMGYACQNSVKCDHVFISHGHMDHCSALHQHASKRSLIHSPPAKYYIGSDLLAPMQTIHENFSRLSEFPFKADMILAKPNEAINLPGPYHVVPFKTVHRVPSIGFLLYKTKSHVKDEFSTRSQQELKELQLRGENVYHQTVTPELAYTGDTTFEVFSEPPIADLLKVKLLITECTYIKTARNVNEAMTRERGHIHLNEIIRNPHLFSNVNALMLVHFSDRYRAHDIADTIERQCPVKLKGKLYSACVHNEQTHIVSYT